MNWELGLIELRKNEYLLNEKCNKVNKKYWIKHAYITI